MREDASCSLRGVLASVRAAGARVLALLFLLATIPSAQAYPIRPQTLWSLTKNAELVVWADIEAVDELPPSVDEEGNAWHDGDVARLRVREVWKGSARPGELVEVGFSSNIICPAPPRYAKGLAVVAFLDRDEGQWWTVGLSYGTRYPTSNDEVSAYRRAVTHARDVQAKGPQVPIEDERAEPTEEQMGWQVLAASHPATRWDGMYGLVPGGDVSRGFYTGSGVNVAVRLSKEQRQQLAQGFAAHPPQDRALPMMLLALRGHASAEVDAAAARALETVMSTSRPSDWTELALDLLRERHGEKVVPRAELDTDPLLRSDKQKGPHPLEQEWKRFKLRHRLTPKLLPLPVEPPVSGTGADTPL